MPNSVMWFRRDLRLRDNPALHAACESDGVLPLFVLDPDLWGTAGKSRAIWLARSLHALDDSLDGQLVVRHGDPAKEVVRAAKAAEAEVVHISAESEPYGSERDAGVEKTLAAEGLELRRTGSPYAVTPGTVRKGDGGPFAVYSPFARQWANESIAEPHQAPRNRTWVTPLASQGIPAEPHVDGLTLPPVGEEAALKRWRHFRDGALDGYEAARNRPDVDGTSALSAHLKFGEIHPRTLLADLRKLEKKSGTSRDIDRYRAELIWREFYADVLWHHPASLTESLKPEIGNLSDPDGKAADEHFEAWAAGRTGYPIVDAGMRQLREIGWMHNRVRMITGSFFVKDLHLYWERGANHFLEWLRDGDPASNNHGWQWVAGCGTDPAPFFRIFNPVKQGLQYDPNGDYVRRYVPELRDVEGAAVHEPWKLDALPNGYPERIVDHDEERKESLRRFEGVKKH